MDDYLLRASGESRHFIAGNSRPRSPDLVDDIYPAFPLMLEAGEQADIFLRVQSETVRQLPLEMITTERLAGAQSREQLAHSAMFGYLFALMVMGLLFGVITRERGFVLYALALAGCLASFFILGGFYVWLDLPGRGLVAKQGLILVSEFVLFMMLVYVRYLLDLPRNMPGINRLVTWTLRASGVIVLAMLVTPYRIAYPAILIHMSLVGGISVVVAFMARCKGLKEARFYALAWRLFWTLFALNTYKHIAAESVSRPFWEKAFAGSAFAMTFFFFAMADRVREIRRAAGRAQDKLLELEQQASRDLRNKLRQEQLLIRDLHDGIGGLTANLAILAEVGRRDAPANLERDRFERISQMASDGSVEVRGLMSSLEARDMSWPDFFDECPRFGRVALNPHGIDFQLDETGFADQAGPGVYAGLSLLRVVKEAMTNAVKHAQGAKVNLSAEFAADRLRIIIRDDGKGLASTINHGSGLRNMEARMLEMLGNMTYTSMAGFEIVLELPLPVVLVDVEPGAGKRAVWQSLDFFTLLNRAWRFGGVREQDREVAKLARALGIGAGLTFDAEKLTEAQRRGLERAVKAGFNRLIAHGQENGGLRNGWRYATNLGRYGDNHLLAPAVGILGHGGNLAEEAMYLPAFTDHMGEPLTGERRYRIHFAPDQLPPVAAFWSVTLYSIPENQLKENPINRYAFDDRTPGLRKNDDGSLTIHVQKEKPDGEAADNWLPTGEGPFWAIMRMYMPTAKALTGGYAPPYIERLN